jgi:hypothetical protein
VQTTDLVTDEAIVGAAGYSASKVMGKATTFRYGQQSEAANKQVAGRR